MGRRRTTVSIYEVPSFLRDANLAAYVLQFGNIVSATHDGMRGEWRFDIMLDVKTFYSVPNWLEVEGCRLPVIVSGRKPACWHCGEIGHLSAVCPGKKAPKKPDHKPGTLPPVVASNTEKEAPVVSPTPVGTKNRTPPSSPTVNSEESGAEWLTGKRWEEAPTCGSSLPKVIPGGHQQSTPLTSQVQQQQFSIICQKNILTQN